MLKAELFHPPQPTKPNEKYTWHNLKGCSQALALAHAAKSSHPMIIITNNTQSAYELSRELALFACPSLPIIHFPDWEILPYDTFSPHQDIISQRLQALSQLPTLTQGIVVASIGTLLHRICPVHFVHAHRFMLKVGESLDWKSLSEQLVQSGYRGVSQVMAHGEFAARGSVIDIFPMGSDMPFRIDLFGDQIDSLRTFDCQTQRSLQKQESLVCLPAHEFPLTQEAIRVFRQNWRTHFEGEPGSCPIYQDISQGLASAGIEYYLPLFFEQNSTLFEYFPKEATVFYFDQLEQAANQLWSDIKGRYEQYRHDRQRPILPPSLLFLETHDIFARLKAFKRVGLNTPQAACSYDFATEPLPDLSLNPAFEKSAQSLALFLQDHPFRVLLFVESAGRKEIILELLNRQGIYPKLFSDWQAFQTDTAKLGIAIASLDEGAILPTLAQTWITESQLYGQQVLQRRRRKKSADPENFFADLSELTPGTSVVHIEHGVGRYRGLMHICVDEIEAEYLMLEYADNDKLYVPVASLHLISRYSAGPNAHAPLHKLGTDQWEKAKRKAAEKAHDVAAELLEICAKRTVQPGHAFSPPNEEYYRFANSFAFEETPDQTKAIQAVLEDMQNPVPMDRLICGDVGFGKTEVALRAAFLAVQDNKQVIFLCPTTLLAQQHFETCQNRFASWPIKIDVLSRFRSAKEQAAIIDNLREGRIDIIVGTHKLLQPNIQLRDVGLVIIDEEHRFGVRQKEQLKKLRAQADILTLTATPIPRTLNLALSSLRAFSIIGTPPAKRLSIKTFVRETHFPLIQEAILRELMRGGQVYYLHNEVSTIEKTALMLSEAFTQARVGVAHGQMPERELEKKMSDFYHQRFNILVCTTIIETGIDIPSANTIIIDRADKLGLAQLHQLRGRVGRSHHQAYAYCLTPPPKQLSSDAIKRLEALESLEELGSGFTLATHDLEIRGAGEFLGEEQSGNVDAIGFNLYMTFLERAINHLKAGKTQVDYTLPVSGVEIDLRLPALIPEHYLPDVCTRLGLYKRLANVTQKTALIDLQCEMVDRFGPLPPATQNLFKIADLKINAAALGIIKIEAGPASGKIAFDNPPKISPDKIIRLIQSSPQHFRFAGSCSLKFMYDMADSGQRLETVQNLISQLSS